MSVWLIEAVESKHPNISVPGYLYFSRTDEDTWYSSLVQFDAWSSPGTALEDLNSANRHFKSKVTLRLVRVGD
jgi:hypothetical protein